MAKNLKTLFVCIHNSARSQIAEAYMNKFGSEYGLEAESAGLTPGKLNPYAVIAMMEDGVDISKNSCKSVFDFHKEGRKYNYLITVCDESSAETCPIFPGMLKRMHWSFDDPSSFEGSDQEKIAKTRIVRDEIKESVIKLISLAREDRNLKRTPQTWKMLSIR